MQTRFHARFNVTIPATIDSRIFNRIGMIRDLSLEGAKVEAEGFRQGDRVTLQAMGQTIAGTVAWADPDRFGMKFDQPLPISPLRATLGKSVIASSPAARRTFGRKNLPLAA